MDRFLILSLENQVPSAVPDSAMFASSAQSPVRPREKQPYGRMICAIVCCMWVSLLLTGCATIRKLNPIESSTLEARRLTQQAESAIHESNWEEAEQKLISAIEKNPEDNRARNVLSEVLWERGDKRAAVEQKSRAISLSGRRDPYNLTELGQMELSSGNAEAALECADEAIQQDSTLADAWTLRGFALRDLGRPDLALEAYYRSLSIRNNDPRTRLEIARVYQQGGQPRRALAILNSVPRDAVASCPHFSDVCYLRGVALRDLNRPADAANELAAALESGCANEDLLLHLADAQLAAGQVKEAQQTAAKLSASRLPKFELALQELQGRIAEKLADEPAPLWR